MVRQSNRRRAALLVTLGSLLVLILAGGAAALQLQTGSTVFKFDARISPKRLSRTAATPAAATVSGQIFTADGSVPPALKKIRVKVGNDVSFETVGLPTCRSTQIQARNSAAAARACRRALLGRGTMQVEVAFPGTAPVEERGKMLIFNAGIKHGVPELLAHSYVTDPVPASIVTSVQIRHSGKGHGALATATVPTISGGAGSVISFKVKVAKKYSFRGRAMSVVSASCGHRRIRIGVRGLFRNGTSVRGGVAHGCEAR